MPDRETANRDRACPFHRHRRLVETADQRTKGTDRDFEEHRPRNGTISKGQSGREVAEPAHGRRRRARFSQRSRSAGSLRNGSPNRPGAIEVNRPYLFGVEERFPVVLISPDRARLATSGQANENRADDCARGANSKGSKQKGERQRAHRVCPPKNQQAERLSYKKPNPTPYGGVE